MFWEQLLDIEVAGQTNWSKDKVAKQVSSENEARIFILFLGEMDDVLLALILQQWYILNCQTKLFLIVVSPAGNKLWWFEDQCISVICL